MRTDFARHPTLTLEGGQRSLHLFAHERKAQLDGVTVWLNGSVDQMQGRWVVGETDCLHVLEPLLYPFRHVAELDSRVIVLDAGHGGHDPGAVGVNGLHEKDVVLDIALRVEQRLVRQGLTVLMTRRDDRFVELAERTAFAQRHNADLFVSVHANASNGRAARGVETFRLSAPGFPTFSSTVAPALRATTFDANRFDAANTILGYAIQSRLVQRTRSTDRGLKHERFQVLREAPCPAVLVECGFLCNPAEARDLSRVDYRNQVADGIADGVLHYVGTVRRAHLIRRMQMEAQLRFPAAPGQNPELLGQLGAPHGGVTP